MKKVSQKRRTDCGVACVAMISGTKYEVAKKAMGEAAARRTQVADLRRALKKLGYDLGHRSVSVTYDKLKTLSFDCILKTKPGRISGNWHWMVWDHRAKAILDPFPEGKTYKKPEKLIAAYIQIKRTGEL